jgi:nucleotide-binding universal stress UspA family protein
MPRAQGSGSMTRMGTPVRRATAGTSLLLCGDLALPNNPAVSVAFEEAALRGCGLQAVHIPHCPLTRVSHHWRQGKPLPATRGAEADEYLAAAQLAAWHDLFPQVAVRMQRPQPTRRPPLIDATRRVRLVVMAAPPHHKTSATWLRSVSKDLFHNSHCPVLVVAHRDGTGAKS